MSAEFLIVGSGLTGSVIARELADAGKSVLVLERRRHVGGNVHDADHESGIRIHSYGPHYFRTNDDDLWSFVNRFGAFYRYEASLKSWVDGRYENWPIAGSYIRRIVGDHWTPDFTGEPKNFEEASLAMMPRPIYQKFVKGYSEKQWGVPASQLSASLAKRFDVRQDDEARLVRHRHQGIPDRGYAHFMLSMLDGIQVLPGIDYLKHRSEFQGQRLTIFTGPVDEFFGFDLGRLKYRGQVRTHEYLADVEFHQPCGQVNNPDPNNGPHIRTIEWKHIMRPDVAATIRGTVVTREVTVTPDSPEDYEYPFPDEANARLYRRYRERAREVADLMICGRLGEYRYYDMDQAIARARRLARRILSSHHMSPQLLAGEGHGHVDDD